MIKNKNVIFSIDFEAWFQIENLSHLRNDISLFDKSLLEEQLDILLEFLKEKKIKATFFVLGSVALKFRNLLYKISENGHEISSHGFSHKLNYELSYIDLKEDIKKSKETLEDIIQKEIIGYRAPCFSIEDRLFEILGDLNFKYDSSLNISSLNSRYGKLNKYKVRDLQPFHINKFNIIEYPLPVFKIKNFKYPISGGGFGRLTPRYLWKLFIIEFFKKYDVLILYLHPWEIDPNIPRIKTKFKNDFANYYGIGRYMNKINFLYEELQNFSEWCCFRDIQKKFQNHDFLK